MKNLTNSVFILSICILLALGCSNADKNNNQATANQPAPPAAINEKPVAVSASQLTKDYDENELSADGKYKGKSLEVSGKIEDIAETFGNVTVSLTGHKSLQTVMCSFPESEKANVAKLKKGQTTTLIGTGDGKTAGLYVGLNNCRVK